MGRDPPPASGGGDGEEADFATVQLDIKTVRRALEQPRPPVWTSSPRVRNVDPWREQITHRLDQDRRLTAKRIRRLLVPLAGPIAARTVRRDLAALRASTVSTVIQNSPTCGHRTFHHPWLITTMRRVPVGASLWNTGGC